MVSLASYVTYFVTTNYKNKCLSNTKCVTSGVGNAYPSRAPEFTPRFFVDQSLVFCIMFCRSMFVFLYFFDITEILLEVVLSTITLTP